MKSELPEASAQRQARKLAAALRLVEAPTAVNVNLGTDQELRESMATIGMRKSHTDLIIALRPFATKLDLLQRVNVGISTAQQRLGPKWLPYIRVDTDDKRVYKPLTRGPRPANSPGVSVTQQRRAHTILSGKPLIFAQRAQPSCALPVPDRTAGTASTSGNSEAHPHTIAYEVPSAIALAETQTTDPGTSSAGGSGTGSPNPEAQMSDDSVEHEESTKGEGELCQPGGGDSLDDSADSGAQALVLSHEIADEMLLSPEEMSPEEIVDVMLDEAFWIFHFQDERAPAPHGAQAGEGGSTADSDAQSMPSIPPTFPPSAPATTSSRVDVAAAAYRGSRVHAPPTSEDGADQTDVAEQGPSCFDDASRPRVPCCAPRGMCAGCVLPWLACLCDGIAFAFHLIAAPCVADGLLRLSLCIRRRLAQPARCWLDAQPMGHATGLEDGSVRADGGRADGASWHGHGEEVDPRDGATWFARQMLPSSHQLHRDLRCHTLSTLQTPLSFVQLLWTSHLTMLSLASLFDWSWYPVSTGFRIVDHPADVIRHMRVHGMTLSSIAMLAFMRSRLCTALAFERAAWVYMAVLVVAYCSEYFVDAWTEVFCSRCVAGLLNYTRAADGQAVHYSQPAPDDYRMGLFGIILRQGVEGNFNNSPSMTPTVEEWAKSLVSTTLDSASFTHVYAVMIAFLSPVPPLQTMLLIVPFTYTRFYFEESVDLKWTLEGLPRACCALGRPLTFQYSLFLFVLFAYTVHREWSALLSSQLSQAQRDLAAVRIEQLTREKERLDYERRLSLHIASYSKGLCAPGV